MIVTITHDHAARRRSYELIAQALDLSAASQDPPVHTRATIEAS
jgi:hypothetical protein